MSRLKVEDYLEQGIYGPKEIKPGERREFLGTLRERVVIVLKKSQVFEMNVYPEIEQMMKRHPRSKLFLNGQMDYQYLGKYIKLAISHNIPYKIVLNKDHNSDLGLVLAENNAINNEVIYIEKKNQDIQVIKKKSVKAFFKRWIKKILNKH
ncbi:YueI family protein [Peribacillus simplex]|uniref:YueI family protein n=1 Tax=Peribacillus simplex TaxID=1478 RepID=A0AAW7IF05_9BACI|nr:YueI family protein [Peribacillus simplex]MDM5294539.1 YueI family protein [Peribacillus simplex]MDM5453488.1 YueI family protein [Peribacillus simplex]